MGKVRSYGKVWNYHDHSVKGQFFGRVEIEEKVDGSQFSIMVDAEGHRHCRSKGATIFPDNAGMFANAIEGSLGFNFKPGYTYRFEYLSKPKHNTLMYSRVPKGHLVLFEVETEEYRILGYDEMAEEARCVGCEVVPLLFAGELPRTETIEKLMDRESFLGGEKIEGVVIKARDKRHNTDGKVLKAKVVCDDFKERHQKRWKTANPSSKDVVTTLGETLNTEARFKKTLQALRDAGELEGSVRDIGKMMKRFGQDLYVEEEEYVKEQLFNWAWPKIQRTASCGLPQWYERLLAEGEVMPD